MNGCFSFDVIFKEILIDAIMGGIKIEVESVDFKGTWRTAVLLARINTLEYKLF